MFNYQDRVLQDFFIDKIGEERDAADPQVIAELKQRATDKLELMLRYAQTHHCRRRAILDYFGDESDVENCACDVCGRGSGFDNSGNSLPGSAAVIVPDEVVTLIRQILSAIARLRGKFGVGGIAEVLTGSRSERTERWQLDQLTVFGLLRNHTTKRVIAMVHRVIESGLARQRDVGTPGKPIYVVELTAAGIGVMKGEQPPPLSLADLVPSGPGTRASGTNPRALGTNPRAQRKIMPSDDPEEQVSPETLERFERLRAARTELARDRQLPPYCICHDSTLKLIAKSVPDTLARLEQIKGMGPHKVRMYGERLLDALKQS
jgi:ATP-dependent DNA helicase RecQ